MSYLFFWLVNKKNGEFCQWHYSPFIDENKINYSCAEQYMMYQKALLFNDEEIAKKIIESKNPSIMKSLGQQVKNFDEKVWINNREKIVYKGNYYKFTQNPELKNKLIKSNKLIIAEASPFDRIWGIGFDAKKALHVSVNKWGKNLLGKILMDVRENIISNQQNDEKN